MYLRASHDLLPSTPRSKLNLISSSLAGLLQAEVSFGMSRSFQARGVDVEGYIVASYLSTETQCCPRLRIQSGSAINSRLLDVLGDK